MSAPAAGVQVWTGAPSWFGAGEATAATSSLSARLIAVVAGDARSSAAVFTGLEASAVALRVGDDLQPGVRLVQVARDRVELERNGRREVLMLDGRDASAAAPGLPAAAEPAAQTLYRGQLAATMQAGNIADWARGLAPAPGGGILVNDPAQQPLARSLQLQAGDVLKSVNGQNLAQPADMSLLFTAFSQQHRSDFRCCVAVYRPRCSTKSNPEYHDEIHVSRVPSCPVRRPSGDAGLCRRRQGDAQLRQRRHRIDRQGGRADHRQELPDRPARERDDQYRFVAADRQGVGLPVLLSALRQQGFTAVESGKLIKVMPEGDAKTSGGPTESRELRAAGTGS
nr:type II secretion system protein N [Jeongeupia sp. USM3]